jgi:hypothetical protein
MRKEYMKYKYWEDFAYFVIRAGNPFTVAEIEEVISDYAQGCWDGYAMEYGYNNKAQCMAEDDAEAVRKDLYKLAEECKNSPLPR